MRSWLKAFFGRDSRSELPVCCWSTTIAATAAVLVTLLEMAFAGRCGLSIGLDGWADNTLRALFAEGKLGAVVQIKGAATAFRSLLHKHGLRSWRISSSDAPRTNLVALRRATGPSRWGGVS